MEIRCLISILYLHMQQYGQCRWCTMRLNFIGDHLHHSGTLSKAGDLAVHHPYIAEHTLAVELRLTSMRAVCGLVLATSMSLVSRLICSCSSQL